MRVVIADDHPIVLAGLESLLQREEDIAVVHRCADGVETLRAVAKHEPDVLVLDLRMPRADGVTVLRHMHEQRLPTRTVLLAAVVDDDELVEAIRLGVRGIVLKEMAPQLLVECLRKVYSGGQWFEQRVVGDAMEKLVRREAAAREVRALLSRREIEVVRGRCSRPPQSADRRAPRYRRGHRQAAPAHRLHEAESGRPHRPARQAAAKVLYLSRIDPKIRGHDLLVVTIMTIDEHPSNPVPRLSAGASLAHGGGLQCRGRHRRTRRFPCCGRISRRSDRLAGQRRRPGFC